MPPLFYAILPEADPIVKILAAEGARKGCQATRGECKVIYLLSRDRQIPVPRQDQGRPPAARSRFVTGIWQSPLSEVVGGLVRARCGG